MRGNLTSSMANPAWKELFAVQVCDQAKVYRMKDGDVECLEGTAKNDKGNNIPFVMSTFCIL
jgi:hypothetical protein